MRISEGIWAHIVLATGVIIFFPRRSGEQKSQIHVCMNMCMNPHTGCQRTCDLAGVYRDVHAHAHVCTHVYTNVYTGPYIHIISIHTSTLFDGAVLVSRPPLPFSVPTKQFLGNHSGSASTTKPQLQRCERRDSVRYSLPIVTCPSGLSVRWCCAELANPRPSPPPSLPHRGWCCAKLASPCPAPGFFFCNDAFP